MKIIRDQLAVGLQTRVTPVLPDSDLIREFIPVLVTCNFYGDPIKDELAIVLTPFCLALKGEQL